MTTDVSLCNRALTRLGLKTISGFAETTEKAAVCEQMYPGVRDSIIAMHPWRFATGKSGALDRLTTDPPNEWKYAYQLPIDLMSGPYAVFNSDQGGAIPTARFEVFEDMVFTNDEKILIDYRFRPPESKFPPLFSELMTYAIAAAVGMILTDREDLVRLYHESAWGVPSDNLRGGLFAVAARNNAMTNAAMAVEADDLVVARFS